MLEYLQVCVDEEREERGGSSLSSKELAYQPLYKTHMDVLHIQTFLLVPLHKICIKAPPRMPQSVKSTYSKNFIEHLFKKGEIVQLDLHVHQKSTPISNQNNIFQVNVKKKMDVTCQ